MTKTEQTAVIAAAQRDFGGKAALVTGGSRGIGLAIAQELVKRGAKVAITARKPDELAAAISQLGGAAHAISFRGSADDQEHQAGAVAGTIAAFGSLDILVNNVAINPHAGPAIEADPGVFRKILDVNLVAVLTWTQLAYTSWMKDHSGAVLNVSSIAGLRPGPLSLYGVSKAAQMHLTRQLAAELAPGVRVNGIAPGVVKTKFASGLYEGDEAGAAARFPLGRLGLPGDIAKLAAFLLSEDASWITGEVVIIDGGFSVADN